MNMWKEHLKLTYGESFLDYPIDDEFKGWKTGAEIESFSEEVFYKGTDFVYDYPSGLVFTNILDHVFFMASLWHMKHKPEKLMNFSECADLYIDSGQGIYKSSVSEKIMYNGGIIPHGFRHLSNRFLIL